MPQDVLAFICSLTDEITIFNLGCSCQKLHQNLIDAKGTILNALHQSKAYGLNALNSTTTNDEALLTKLNPRLNIVQSILFENIGFIQHHITMSSSSCDTSTVRTCLFQVPPMGDVLTSLKLKGDVLSLVLGFEGATQLHNHTDISNALFRILPKDDDGYVEVVSLFCQYGFLLAPLVFQQMLIRVGFKGTLLCKASYLNIHKHHKARLPKGDVCMNVIRTSRIFMEDWTYWKSSTCKKVVFFPATQGTKGIAITLSHLDTQNEDNLNNQEVIEYIDVLHTDLNEKQCVYRLSGRKLFASNIIKKRWYNLPFHLEHCWYIPLNDYRYHPKYGTIFYIKFRSIPKQAIRIEGTYFTDDCVVNKLV